MIDIEALIRKIQIDLITDIPNPVTSWALDYWSRVKVLQADVYHNDGGELIYYEIISTGEIHVLFFRDDKNSKFWVSHHYWACIEIGIRENYDSTNRPNTKVIRRVTKVILEYLLKETIADPVSARTSEFDPVYKSLKPLLTP